MKRKFYIPILIVCLFTACSEQIPEPDINGGGDGEVLINILPPRIATTDDQLTRSMVTEAMPAGSTIRLYVYDANTSEGENNPYSNNRLQEKEMTFKVRSQEERNNSSDKRALVPWRVDPVTGEALEDGEITHTDLHLPGALYDFFAISPAVQLNTSAIDGYDVPGYRFRHGGVVAQEGDIPVTLYTSSPLKGIQISQDAGQVTEGTPGVYNIQLEPFTYNAFSTNFFIGEQKLRETILTEEGAVFGTVSIRNARNVYQQPKGYEDGIHEKTDTWELISEVIPNPDTNTETVTLRSRDVKLTFHLLINGDNYKSYESVLRNQRFERGSEYTYEVTVNAGGIFVRGWRNAQWTVTIPR